MRRSKHTTANLAFLAIFAAALLASPASEAAPFEASTGWVDFFLPLTDETSGSYPDRGTSPDSVTLNASYPSSGGYLDMSLDFPELPQGITSATLYIEYLGKDALCMSCPTAKEKKSAGVPASDPGLVTASFSGGDSSTSVEIVSCKDLSNVVLKFSNGAEYKYDGLDGESGTFEVPPEYAGETIAGVWVKSGNNASGDGPGYGWFIENDGSGFGSAGTFAAGQAQVTHTVNVSDTLSNSIGGFQGTAIGGTGLLAIAVPIVPDLFGTIPINYGLNIHLAALAELSGGGSVKVHNLTDSLRATIRGETSDVTPIPEPAVLALLLGGIGTYWLRRRAPKP